MFALSIESLQNTTEANQNWPGKHIFQILSHLEGSILGFLRHIIEDMHRKKTTTTTTKPVNEEDLGKVLVCSGFEPVSFHKLYNDCLLLRLTPITLFGNP